MTRVAGLYHRRLLRQPLRTYFTYTNIEQEHRAGLRVEATGDVPDATRVYQMCRRKSFPGYFFNQFAFVVPTKLQTMRYTPHTQDTHTHARKYTHTTN